MRKIFYFALLMSMPAVAQQSDVVATFEDLALERDCFWNGSDGTGGFVSGGFRFENGYEVMDYGGNSYAYAYGFYYSTMTATSFADYATDQYNSCVGHGAEGSATYAVYNVNNYTPKGIEVLGGERVVPGCYLTNAACAYWSMMQGDGYAKKFGAGDWFKLTITGLDAAGAVTGAVDFYLADMREGADGGIVDDWQWVDLSCLGRVARLSFDMSSSDSGQYGMNTPAYFCLDNLGAAQPGVDPSVGVAAVEAAGDGVPVAIYSASGVRRSALAAGLNIVKYGNGVTKKIFVR